jgi:pSer/pThr/pTyr-binding forkhead associated (FHA) protein
MLARRLKAGRAGADLGSNRRRAMRDGNTRKIPTFAERRGSTDIFSVHRFSLMVVKGPAKGQEILLKQERTIIGRGPGVDAAIPDEAMSRQHFAIELGHEGFRVRDLGSTNGIQMNGKPIDNAHLSHGDRLQVGGHELQFLVDELQAEPPTWLVEG